MKSFVRKIFKFFVFSDEIGRETVSSRRISVSDELHWGIKKERKSKLEVRIQDSTSEDLFVENSTFDDLIFNKTSTNYQNLLSNHHDLEKLPTFEEDVGSITEWDPYSEIVSRMFPLLISSFRYHK